jgi:hypothetical protein
MVFNADVALGVVHICHGAILIGEKELPFEFRFDRINPKLGDRREITGWFRVKNEREALALHGILAIKTWRRILFVRMRRGGPKNDPN